MIECPDCHGVLRPKATRCSCGWQQAKTSNGPAPDPLHFTCSDEYQGQRCRSAGTLSQGTLGGGPWYCAKHFPLFRGSMLPKGAMPTGFKTVRDVYRTPSLDAESAAERDAIESQ